MRRKKEGRDIRRKVPYAVPDIVESLAVEVESGKITLEDAAWELHRAGWTNYVDVERTKRLLSI